MDDAVDEVVGLLARRRDVLEFLSDAMHTQAALADELPISRSTVTRALRELGERDLVVRDGDGYRTTRLADTLLESHDRFRTAVAASLGAGDLFEFLPPGAPFDPGLLATGTYHPLEQGASFSVRERVNEQFRDAVSILGLGRTRSEQESGDIFYRKIVEEGRPVENVLSVDLFEHIVAEDWYAEFREHDNLEFYVHESVPYGLFVLEKPEDRRVVLILYDEDDAMKGVLCSTAAEAITWAESVYEDFREAAVPASEYLA